MTASADTKPNFFSYVDLEPRETFEARCHASIELQKADGATFARFTIVNDEFPKEPYPHGFYIKGWRERPAVQPPFDYPLTAEGDPEKKDPA